MIRTQSEKYGLTVEHQPPTSRQFQEPKLGPEPRLLQLLMKRMRHFSSSKRWSAGRDAEYLQDAEYRDVCKFPCPSGVQSLDSRL